MLWCALYVSRRSARQQLLLLHVCNKKKAIKAMTMAANWPQQQQPTTTTTTTIIITIIMMTTTTTTTTIINNNTTAQQQRTTKMRTPGEQKEERLRNRWEDRVTDALFRQLKRKVRAANALFGTPEWVSIDVYPTWFMLHLARHAQEAVRLYST